MALSIKIGSSSHKIVCGSPKSEKIIASCYIKLSPSPPFWSFSSGNVCFPKKNEYCQIVLEGGEGATYSLVCDLSCKIVSI